jgi:tryptophan-rich sensory protein
MTWVYTVPIILALGILSGWASGSGNRNPWFRALAKPGWMPPGWAFPVVWSALYIAMGVALARVLDAPIEGKAPALALFAFQLVLNLAWSPVFFRWHRPDRALELIWLLDAAVLATIIAFARIDTIAAALLLPYLVWLGLATALNRAILARNPQLAKPVGRPT